MGALYSALARVWQSDLLTGVAGEPGTKRTLSG